MAELLFCIAIIFIVWGFPFWIYLKLEVRKCMAIKVEEIDMKFTLSAKILTIYGLCLILGLFYIGVSTDWAYFHSDNILLLALIIASYPILGIALTILEVALGKNGGF